RAYLALCGKDENCGEYIRFATEVLPTVQTQPAAAPTAAKTQTANGTPLKTAIVQGRKETAAIACEQALEARSPLEVIDGEIVPALDEVGRAYEEKRAYLPNLLMSAEAAKSAFEKIKTFLLKTGGTQTKKCKFVIATVKGDIHDIGKNIVKTLLENYGFDVVDLGRDVPAETVVAAVEEHKAPLVGLSALMTTTVPSMEETIALLRQRTPWCKIVVGGAVLNADYAEKIGADA
ncbi:MAG: cobalamin-dependent protein, partial [Clostridia bacterium]|nr:cobalamin-dependent protein [Clostridia bacterium]